jgi:hypothetical protein
LLAARQLEQVGDHVVLVDRAVAQRLDDVTGFLEGALARVDKDPRAPHGPVVALPHLGRIGVLAFAQPLAFDQRPGRQGGAGHDVGRGNRSLALLDGTMLTKRRTACASGLAPHLVRVHAKVRPIREVAIWGRRPAQAEALALRLAASLPDAVGDGANGWPVLPSSSRCCPNTEGSNRLVLSGKTVTSLMPRWRPVQAGITSNVPAGKL